MYCGKCQAELTEDDAFCRSCGSAVSLFQSPPEAAFLWRVLRPFRGPLRLLASIIISFLIAIGVWIFLIAIGITDPLARVIYLLWWSGSLIAYWVIRNRALARRPTASAPPVEVPSVVPHGREAEE